MRWRQTTVIVLASVLMCAAGAWCAVGSGASVRTLYVSPSGADEKPGTRPEPWRTMRRALAALQPGDTLRVRGGTYTERVVDVPLRQGRPDARILVEAEPGERPILKGRLVLERPSYWTFDGINVTWDDQTGSPDEHMVKLVDGVGWTFMDSEIWGARSYAGVLIAGTASGEPSKWTFSGNCVHDTFPTNSVNQDHLLYVNTGLEAGRGVIERNLLFGAVNGMGVKLGGPSASEGGATGVDVRFNSIYGTGQGVLVAGGSRDNVMRRNIIYKVGSGYGNVRSFELTGTGNVLSENTGGGAARLLLEDPGYGRLVEGPGNRFPVNPQFDSTSGCDGFHPRNATVKGYGRYGVPETEQAERRPRPWTGAALALLAGAGVAVAPVAGLWWHRRRLRHGGTG